MASDVESNSDSHPPSYSSSSSRSGSKASTGATSTSSNHIQNEEPEPEPEALPRIYHTSYSSTPPRRGARRNGQPVTPNHLGAIDEDSNSVAPDVPRRHPGRNANRPRKIVGFIPGDASKFFSWSSYSRPHEDVPPPGAYDGITGPRGEKFSDLRQNKPFRPPGRGGWKRMICLGSVVALIVLLAVGLGVGLGVGLTRRKGTSSSNSDSSQSSSNNDSNSTNQPFPMGTWSIPTYLTSTQTNCTANPSTWRCYPYSTYSQSHSSSYSILPWRISSPTNSTLNLFISSTNPLFSYPFTDLPLTLSNANDERLSAFTFDFTYRKQVVPNADITGNNTATRCYFNNTQVSVRLYSDAQGAGGQIVGPPTEQGAQQSEGQSVDLGDESWPYAIEFEEKEIAAPECFLYVNGVEGARVDVGAGTGGDCICAYRNYGLS